jgi:hypothetical protein
MYEQVYETLKKATEANVQIQQEMFKKWFGMFPGLPASPNFFGDNVQQFQKKWGEAVQEIIKRQREFTESQFKIGLENIEKAFQLGEAKNFEELRTKTLELWKVCFTNLNRSYDAQVREFQNGVEKWTELLSKSTV